MAKGVKRAANSDDPPTNIGNNGRGKNPRLEPETQVLDLPPLETAEFRLITLPNHLKALLISSKPQADKEPDWALTFPQQSNIDVF
jgi:hypothetical protein